MSITKRFRWGLIAAATLLSTLSPTVPASAADTSGADTPGTAAPGTAAPGSIAPGSLRVRSGAQANAAAGPLTAADLQDAYNLPSDLLGGGETVAVVVPYDNPDAEFDLAAYRDGMGLPACTAAFPCFRKINQDGGDVPPPANSGYALHGNAGLQMASAACPNCRLLLVEADDPSLASLGAAVDQAVAQGADAVTVMTGVYEYEGQGDLAAHFDHPGVAITAGVDAGFNTQGRQLLPSAYPSVVAVGGTELFRDPATARGWTERAWTAGGSGCSVYEARPKWQKAGDCGARRTVADVAAVAADSTLVQLFSTQYGGWVGVSGGPLSPAFVAGVYGLAGSESTRPAGQRLYGNSRQLFDITAGSNGSCGGGYLCTAGTGYDGPTGVGTPNGIGAF